jgi:hypothetical protein
MQAFKNTYKRLTVIVLLASLLQFSAASADTTTQILQNQILPGQELPGSSVESGYGIAGTDMFGSQIVISGNDALVSSQFGVFEYQFTAGKWTAHGKLNVPIPHGASWFSLAMSNSTAIVGIASIDEVLVFNKQNDAWIQTQVIQPPVIQPTGTFGQHVTLSGTTLVVSDPNGTTYDQPYAKGQGAVFVYNLSGPTWYFKEQLHGDTGSVPSGYSMISYDSMFGLSLAISGDVMAVSSGNGQPCVNSSILFPSGGSLYCSGAVYIYKRQNGVWLTSQLLTGIPNQTFQGLGRSLAFSGTSLLVGGIQATSLTERKGTIYVFNSSNGTFALGQQIDSPTIRTDPCVDAPYFGSPIQVVDNTAIIGQTQICGGYQAFVFKNISNEWRQVAVLHQPVKNGWGWGTAIAFNGSQILVSSPWNSPVFASTYIPGEIYVYSISSQFLTSTTTTFKKPVTTTINCYKGKLLKKVTAVKPVCPAGYKKK